MFKIGDLVMTRAINDTIMESVDFSMAVLMALQRYQRGDWGDISEDDKLCNDLAIQNGERLCARYNIKDSKPIFIITEWDRSCTTILFRSEY